MDDYLRNIDLFPGAGELSAVLSRWERLAQRRDCGENGQWPGLPESFKSILPDMLWISPPASGKTYLLHMMAEHLNVSRQMLFTGNVKFTEFFLDYCEPGVEFSSLRRLMSDIKNASGFRPEFSGIVHIDIDDWVGHEKEKHFHTFLEYLSDHGDDWLIVLSITGVKDEKLKSIKAVVCSFLRLETVTLKYPETKEMLDMIKNYIGKFGLTLSDDAQVLLMKSIEKLRGNAYFDGLKTVEMLAKDIAYQCMSDPELPSGQVGARQLEVFSSDGEYIGRQMKYIAERHLIGFTQ